MTAVMMASSPGRGAGAAGGGIDAASSSSSIYRRVLNDAQATAGARETPTYRVVVVGDLESGKRTFAQKLRDSLAFGNRAARSSNSRKFYGVDFSYVDVRAAHDGTLRHTVEFVALDAPPLLEVAIQPSLLTRTVVVVTCDASNPRDGLKSIDAWVAAINARVQKALPSSSPNDSNHHATPPPTTTTALARARLQACLASRDELRPQLPPAMLQAPEAGGTNFELRTIETVCLLPMMLAVTKLDLCESRTLGTQVSLPNGGQPIQPERYLRDSLRAAAIRYGAALTMAPDARTNASEDEFVLCVAEYLVALAASGGTSSQQLQPEGGKTTTSAGNTNKAQQQQASSVAVPAWPEFSAELAPSRILPMGGDNGATIPQAISAGAIDPFEVFFASDDGTGSAATATSAAAGSSSNVAGTSSATRFESHQQQLRTLAPHAQAAQAALAPAGSVSPVPARGVSTAAAAASREATLSPSSAGVPSTTAAAVSGPRGASVPPAPSSGGATATEDEIDFDFDELN